MKLHTFRFGLSTFVLISLGSLLLAAACAQPSEEVAEPTVTPVVTIAPGEPRVGGTLRVYESRQPSIWDPMLSESSPPAQYASLLYPRLFLVKTGPGIDPNVHEQEADLVESWETPDETTYIFHLRQNGKWGPEPPLNGRSIVADDVVFSLNRLRQESAIRTNFAPLETVEALDEFTVKVTLKHPFAPFIAYLSDTSAIIVPHELVEEHGDLTRREVAQKAGGGPWLLESFDSGVKVVYRRNPDYYRSPLPYFDRLVINILPDTTARETAFESKQLDIAGFISARRKESMEKAQPEIQWGGVGGAHFALYFNTGKKPWSDPRVREAVSMAIDRDAFIQARYAGAPSNYESPVRSFLAPWALPQDELRQLQPYDPEGAKTLLAEAGYEGGFDAGTWYAWPGGSGNVRDLELVKDMLERNLGITFTIQQVEYSQNNTLIRGGDFDVAHVVYSRRYPDPDQYLYPRLHSTGPLNYSKCEDPKLDGMLDEQRRTVDKTQRLQQIHEIQRYFIGEVRCILVLPQDVDYTGWWPWVEEYHAHVGHFGHYDKLGAWLDETQQP